MKTIAAGTPDLRRQPPRSGSATLGRYPWLARLNDKARADRAGTAGDYTAYCETSVGFLDRCGITVDAFSALIESGDTGGEIVAYFDAHVSDDQRAEAVRWIREEHEREIEAQDTEEGRVYSRKDADVRDAWVRIAHAEWRGGIARGYGEFSIGADIAGSYSFDTRFGNAAGNTPEELLAAAHATCFSMSLSLILSKAGHLPSRISTVALVTVEKRGVEFTITTSRLECVADVPGLENSEFRRLAHAAKDGCPVSRALAGVEISLQAELASTVTC